MTESGRKYLACERDALALMFSLRKFGIYLFYDKKLQLVKYIQELQYYFDNHDRHGLLVHWMDFLAEYDFRVKYRSVANNGAADFLSSNYLWEHESNGDEGDTADIVLGSEVTKTDTWEEDWLDFMAHLEGKELPNTGSHQKMRMRRMAMMHMFWNGRLLRRVRQELLSIPPVARRFGIISAPHD